MGRHRCGSPWTTSDPTTKKIEFEGRVILVAQPEVADLLEARTLLVEDTAARRGVSSAAHNRGGLVPGILQQRAAERMIRRARLSTRAARRQAEDR